MKPKKLKKARGIARAEKKRCAGLGCNPMEFAGQRRCIHCGCVVK